VAVAAAAQRAELPGRVVQVAVGMEQTQVVRQLLAE